MADELGAELSLDLESARRDIEGFRRDIEDELERAVTTFGDEYERVVNGLPSIDPEINADAITDELNGAIRSVDAEIGVTPDVDALQSEVSDALGAINPPLEVDTDPMVTQIEDLFDSFHPALEPELDTTAIQASLDELGGATGGIGDISEGLDQAGQEAVDFDEALKELNKSAGESGDALGNVSNVSTTLATAFSAAKGDGRQLISQIGQLSPSLGRTLGPVAALTAGFVGLFAAGQRSLASAERAQVVLGDAAERLESINVGGLTGSLGDLAVQAGVSGGALRNAASNAAQLGLQSGHSKDEVIDFTEKVNALALRAVALNPALGEAGSVAERLNLVLGRGGRFLNRYQIDLTSAEITMRALADTGKTSARDLTSFERSVAGANIAVEKLGNTIGTDFQRGAEQTSVQIKSIRAELNSAFARAGKPLVEPTIEALHSLADAGAGVSEALGALGESVLPVASGGLATLGRVAGTASEALGEIPGEAIAAAAAVAILQRTLASTFGRNAETGLGIRTFGDLRAAGSLAMETITGRSVVALGAVAGLDAGLKALGTSTKELGIDFITTGAAIGFAFGGPQGAVFGAAAGGIAAIIGAETRLEQATAEVDAEFTKAEASAGNLRSTLFANADTAEALSGSLAGLRDNLADFVQTASAFKALGVNDDLHRIGISAAEVGDLSRQGDAGLTEFIQRLQRAGEVGREFRRVFAGDEQVQVLAKQLERAGVGARFSAEQFAGLSKTEQRLVLDALKLDGANTKLIIAFGALQKQAREAERQQFLLFASTNKLSPAIQRAAREMSRGEDGAVDFAKALGILSNAAVGLLPEFGRLTSQSALLRRELTGIQAAAEQAAGSIPTLGTGLSDALQSSFFDATQNLTGKPFLDTDKLIGDTVTATFDFGVFFGNIERIAEQGAGNVATALLQLGPSNLGARVAAELAANEPLFREGLEKALEGMSKAQLVSDSILGSLKARASLLASIQGSTFEQLLQQEFGEIDVSKLTNSQIIAFIQKYGTGGNQAAQEFVDKFNLEIASRKIAGLPVDGILADIASVKEKIPAEAQGLVDVYTQALDGTAPTVEAASKKLTAPIPASLEDIQPSVIAGISQVGDLLTTGAARSTDEYEKQFQVERVTIKAMDDARNAIYGAQTPITNAITGTIVGAVDDAGFAAGVSSEYIGTSMMDGIARGVLQRQLELDLALARAAGSALDAGYAAIAGGSPARKFIPLGSSMIEGVEVGVEERSKVMHQAFGESLLAARDGLFGAVSSGFGPTPRPPAGIAPIVQVMIDPSMVSQSLDRSITVNGGINNYGSDPDSRGVSTVRRLSDYAHLSSYGG